MTPAGKYASIQAQRVAIHLDPAIIDTVVETVLETFDHQDDAIAEIVLEVFAKTLKLFPARGSRELSLVELSAVVPVYHESLSELSLHGTLGVVHRCAEALFHEPRHQLLTSEFEDAWGEIANLVAGGVIRAFAPKARLGVPTVINRRLNPSKHEARRECWLDVSFVMGEEGCFQVSSHRKARLESQ